MPHDSRSLPVISIGSTCEVKRLGAGRVVKVPIHYPNQSAIFRDGVDRSFKVEHKIYEKLGKHKYILEYLGPSNDPEGILLAEAPHGNLQAYLDKHDDIPESLRLKWCIQAAESIQHLHSKDVIHSDLRPENFLLQNRELDICLCDFGGSFCGEIDGGHLPDPGFFDPRAEWTSTERTDIFSLGSVFYTIMTNHWPWRLQKRFKCPDEKRQYEDKVDALFLKGEFPPTKNLCGGSIINSCWDGEFKSAEAVCKALKELENERCL